MPANASTDGTASYSIGETYHATVQGEGAIDHLSDEQLVVLVARRDPRALAALYDRHARYVMGMAMAVLRDEAAAEEVTQDVFLKLWRRPESYDASRGRFAVWLLSVTRNQAIDILRGQHGAAVSVDRLTDSGFPIQSPAQDADPDDAASLAEERARVREALRDLPAAQRRVVELAFFSGMTHTEIATHLREPLGTVKTRMRLALRKLRAALGALRAEP